MQQPCHLAGDATSCRTFEILENIVVHGVESANSTQIPPLRRYFLSSYQSVPAEMNAHEINYITFGPL